MPFDPNFGTLSDEELMSLGQQAGYLPGADSSQPPMSQGLTPPDMQLQSPPTSPVTPAPSSTGYSTSNRGFSGTKYGEIEKTTARGLAGDMAQADNRATQGAARDQAVLESTRKPSIDAEKALAGAHAAKIKHEGEQALVLQRLQDGFSVEEAKINAEATAASNQSKTDYLAALADFRGAKVDPGQLWGNMSGFDRFGMMATAFVHDFLGAKGIHTSAMDTFNKAIDRNIDSQIQGIKTKGEVAEGFKSLWYMQRNQSASDTEARARVRGFLLEGAKQQIIANMSQYESALASAQGQAAIAKIDEELGKNLIEIYKHADTNALALRNQALDKWRVQVQASLEQQSLGLKRQELALKKQELAPKQEGLVPIYDPESGQAQWAFNPMLKLKPEEMGRVREQFAATDDVNRSLTELRELVRKGKSTSDAIAGTRFVGTDEQRFDALAQRIAHGMAKANGERATDQVVEQFRKGFRQATWFNMANAEQVIAATQAQVLRQTDSLVRTYAVDVPEEMRGQFGNSSRGESFGASQLDAKNTINPPPMGKEEIIRQQAAKYLAPATAKDSIADDEEILTEGLQAAKEKFVKENPDFAPGPAPKAQPVDQLMGSTPPAPGIDITRFDKGLMMLARSAEGGDTEALKQLKTLAGGYINAGQRDEESMFAAWLLNEVAPGTGDRKDDY